MYFDINANTTMYVALAGRVDDPSLSSGWLSFSLATVRQFAYGGHAPHCPFIPGQPNPRAHRWSLTLDVPRSRIDAAGLPVADACLDLQERAMMQKHSLESPNQTVIQEPYL
jgi:hypothetical protein